MPALVALVALVAFGWTMEVVSGCKPGSTATAVVKVFEKPTPCACSPIGKVSLPMGPTVRPITLKGKWKKFENDSLGGQGAGPIFHGSHGAILPGGMYFGATGEDRN